MHAGVWHVCARVCDATPEKEKEKKEKKKKRLNSHLGVLAILAACHAREIPDDCLKLALFNHLMCMCKCMCCKYVFFCIYYLHKARPLPETCPFQSPYVYM